jgi:hypothetical protein
LRNYLTRLRLAGVTVTGLGLTPFLTGLAFVPMLASRPAMAQAALPVPAQFTVVTAPGDGATSQLVLRWKRVPGATSYEVWRLNKAGKWVLNEDDPNYTPLTNSTTVTGLDADTKYQFRIRAVGDKGLKSALSAVAAGRTIAADISLPSFSVSSGSETTPSQDAPIQAKFGVLEAPGGLFGIFPEADRVRLTWRSVSAAVRYVVEEEVKGTWKPANDVVGAPASTTVILLNHGMPGPWRFRIRAMGSDGSFSEPSWPVTVERF